MGKCVWAYCQQALVLGALVQTYLADHLDSRRQNKKSGQKRDRETARHRVTGHDNVPTTFAARTLFARILGSPKRVSPVSHSLSDKHNAQNAVGGEMRYVVANYENAERSLKQHVQKQQTGCLYNALRTLVKRVGAPAGAARKWLHPSKLCGGLPPYFIVFKSSRGHFGQNDVSANCLARLGTRGVPVELFRIV